MNSPAHQTCDFVVNFGAEKGNFWHISLLWHIAQIRGSMLKKVVQIRDARVNKLDNRVLERPVTFKWAPVLLEQYVVTFQP